MAQPQFWLKVRKEYVMDNFDGLLTYLHKYTIDENPNANSDFEESLRCLQEVADDIFEEIVSTPICQEVKTSYSTVTILRLYTAVLLANRKIGVTSFKSLIRIAGIIARLDLNQKSHTTLINIVSACLREQEMVDFKLTWHDIVSESTFFTGVFVDKFLATTFKESAISYTPFFENMGLILLPSNNAPLFATVNLETYKRKVSKDLSVQFLLQGLAELKVLKSDYERAKDFSSIYRVGNSILSIQDSFRPSPVANLKSYLSEDEIMVRIIENNGYALTAETIDPNYEKIQGKVDISIERNRPDAMSLKSRIKIGDYLEVHLSKKENQAFELSNEFEKYYRSFAIECTNRVYPAIYYSTTGDVDTWITEEGVFVAIHKSKVEALSDEDYNDYESAIDNSQAIYLQFYSEDADIERRDFYQYAAPYNEEGTILYDDILTKESAFRQYFNCYFSDMEEKAETVIQKNQGPVFREIQNLDAIKSLYMILAQLSELELGDSEQRITLLNIVSFMAKMLDRKLDCSYLDFQRRYLSQLASFASNADVVDISVPEYLSLDEKCTQQARVVQELKRYKKVDNTNVELTKGQSVKMSTLEIVSKLVNASNSIIDLIDVTELNTIKQSITKLLGIEDQYNSILDSRTFYGVENINLEFKTSIVFTPKSLYSEASASHDFQKWNIIKAVNGFLNSRSGGDLLIGVNDAGYASGLESDLRELTERNIISTPNLDPYRNYIQTMLERALCKDIPSEKYDIEIARTYIKVLIETNDEKKPIIRIKVTPPPRGIIYLVTKGRPHAFKNAYVRENGRTIEMTPNQRQIVESYRQ